jgi:hypothetical protein
MTQTIEANKVQPGMILDIFGGTERIAVTQVVPGSTSIQITDGIIWRGLCADETVTVAGHFNP